MKNHNLHTHTTYSDGILKPEELLDKAKELNLDVIGITDHAFSTKISGDKQITSNVMNDEQIKKDLNNYLNNLRKLQKECKDIKLLIGIEIDISNKYGINPEDLPFDTLNEFDYILFEYVDTEKESWGEVNGRPISDIVAIRHKIKIPVGLAHNDVQNNFNGKEDYFTDVLSKNNIYLEINQSEARNTGIGRNTRDEKDYYKHYSKKLIKLLIEKGVEVVIGCDSHTPNSLATNKDAIEFIKEKGLKVHKLVE